MCSTQCVFLSKDGWLLFLEAVCKSLLGTPPKEAEEDGKFYILSTKLMLVLKGL